MSAFQLFSISPATTSFWDQYPAAVRSIAYFFLSGGFFMAAIVLCSFLAVSVVIWKILALRKNNILPDDLADAIDTGSNATVDSTSVLGRLASLAAGGDFVTKEDALETVQAHARSEVTRMESGVTALEVVITITPLLGLLGTVSGLVSVFSVLGTGGDVGTDPVGIALGIADALNTTIAGIAVAVPTVIAHSYFTRKIEKHAVRMELLVGKILATRFNPTA
ncbi:MAG: MotA/TolQ/ExbB proton channel family protein [Verrucomicrobiales bacterium]|nr:MotA/TolQ/ExbB proton channel family protein [Verrucomicrobiales bacterium]